MCFTRPLMAMAAVVVLTGCGGAAHTVTVTSIASSESQSPTTQSTSSTTSTGSATSTTELPYSGVAPNTNSGPATDQSVCPGAQVVTVAPDTSCGFADNVATIAGTAHHATGHYPANVTAFSPVTGKTYRLRCVIAGFGTELLCATLAPATGVVVLPFGASAAAPPTTSTSQPAPATPQPATAIEGAGSFSHATDSQFCSTHTCIENFPNGSGYIVQCADGEWSHSGGLSGACSDHGGEG
jgi:hypothetical protein